MTAKTNRGWLLLVASLLMGCGEGGDTASDVSHVTDGAADWAVQATLHIGEPRESWLHGDAWRQVFPFHAGAGTSGPVEVSFAVEADVPVKLALLGPMVDGKRATIATAGYGAAGYVATTSAPFTAQLTEDGEHLLVVQPRDVAELGDARLALTAHCLAEPAHCASSLDAIQSHKVGAVVGTSFELVLNPSLRDAEVPVRIVAAPPWTTGEKVVFEGNASEGRVEVDLADAVAALEIVEGDDLTIVVGDHDDGSRLRFWSRDDAGIRAVVASDFGNVFHVNGVARATAGATVLGLYSEDRGEFLADVTVVPTLPGHLPEALELNEMLWLGEPGTQATPHDGELLSVTLADDASAPRRAYCFSYCNDPSSETEACGLVPVACASEPIW